MKYEASKRILLLLREKQRTEASTEFILYKQLQSYVRSGPFGNDKQLGFDFAKKGFLP